MSMQAPSTAVVASVVVEAPIQRAFKVFTEDMKSWWPKEHRDIDRHGDGWEQMRDAVGSPGGWQLGLDFFAKRVESAG